MVTAPGIRVNGAEFRADHATPITIGRDESSDLSLDNDFVSPHHAELFVDERGWVFRDAGSTNGSFIDGRRVTEHVVDDDVQLTLGDAHEGSVVALELVTAASSATRITARAPPAEPLGAAFMPTHRVPEAGMSTWDTPDPDGPRGPRLDPALEVMVTDTKGAWAHVMCSNGWSAWVDGRVLVPELSQVATAPVAATGSSADVAALVSPLLLVGVALVIVGGFLPWFTGSGVSVNAWDVPLGFVMVDPAESEAPYVGPFLLLALVALAPLLWRRGPPAALLLVVAAVVLAPVIGAVNRVIGLDDGPDLGIGIVVTFAGALVLAVEAWPPTRSP